MFRFAKDKWNSVETSIWEKTILKYDKIQHLIGGFAFGLISVKFSVYFWLIWEIKDGILNYKDYGFWGGDGFSWRDLTCSIMGALLCGILKKVFCGC